VASSLVGSLQSMMNAASSAGINLCGGGYRSSAGQIETRRNNCGTSYYDIYEKPASQCSPPTARPGQSMHERGLAVDFTCNGGGVIASHSSPCFQWLAGNASSYGFYNLPSEPWHWSSNGN
jgi:LAS superfamily LD-carboxypeptidase LdcB